MMNNKVLTVIIPAYNMEYYLHDCLNSLVVPMEWMERLEVLVVNDGSADNTSKIAHEWEERFPGGMVAIDKENGNYGSCVNKGLSMAKGKFVKVLDADDSFDTSAFCLFLRFLQTVDVDLIVSDFCLVDTHGKTTETCTFSLPNDETFPLSALSKRDVKWLWHHAITYRTSLLQAMSYRQTEGISYTDDEWIFKPMANVKTIRHFPHQLYRYLRGREGQTFAPKVLQRSFSQRMIVMESMLRFYASTYDGTGEESRGYLRQKLQLRLESIYHYMLIGNRSRENNQRMKEFDGRVKSLSADAYQLADDVKDQVTGFRYIHHWRMAGYNDHIPTLYILYVKHQCKRFAKKLKLI